MKDVYLIRTIHGLKPYDDASEAALRTFKFGRPVKARLTLVRNPAFHRKCMALIHILFMNQDKYRGFDIFLDVIKLLVGHVEFVPGPGGVKIAIPKSIAFHNMDNLEFEAFYNKVFEVGVTKIIDGVDRGDLHKEVLERVRNFQSEESLAEKEYNEGLA